MLKVGITSDFHLGFKFDERCELDSFIIAKKVLEKLKYCDIICILGDIFDTKNPTPKVVANAIKILKSIKVSNEKIEYFRNGEKRQTTKPLIIALHGNHERKLHKENSPIKILEEAGLVEYLHLEKIRVERNGEKVDFYAMSSVPEIFAAKILLGKWAPHKKIDENAFNILLLHQNISPFVYTKEEPSLSISNLPKEFDLIINGHIHIPAIEKIGNTTLLISGSTIITKLLESEIVNKKKFFVITIEGKKFKIEGFEINQEREYIVKEFSTNDEAFIEKINTFLKSFLFNRDKRPIVKIKIVGDKKVDERRLRNLYNIYKDKVILFFDNQTKEKAVMQKLEELRELKDKRVSIDSFVIQTLEDRLKENGFKNSFDFHILFNLLKEGEIEKAYGLLTQGQLVLKDFWKA